MSGTMYLLVVVVVGLRAHDSPRPFRERGRG